jgi:phosphoglycolate phosphatase-like HAD superfamily hydrolase
LGVPKPIRSDYVKLAFAYLITELDHTERLEILPHVQETLAELKRRGYTMGVVTSRPGAAQRLIEKLAMVGLAAYFDQVVTQEVLTSYCGTGSSDYRALPKSLNFIGVAIRLRQSKLGSNMAWSAAGELRVLNSSTPKGKC